MIAVGRDLRAAFVLVVGLIVTSIISTILKKVIDHKRPGHVFGSANAGDDEGQSSDDALASSLLHVP